MEISERISKQESHAYKQQQKHNFDRYHGNQAFSIIGWKYQHLDHIQ